MGPGICSISNYWMEFFEFFKIYYYLKNFVSFIFILWQSHTTCRVLVPQPAPPAVEALSLNRWADREVPYWMEWNWNAMNVLSMDVTFSHSYSPKMTLDAEWKVYFKSERHFLFFIALCEHQNIKSGLSWEDVELLSFLNLPGRERGNLGIMEASGTQVGAPEGSPFKLSQARSIPCKGAYLKSPK